MDLSAEKLTLEIVTRFFFARLQHRNFFHVSGASVLNTFRRSLF